MFTGVNYAKFKNLNNKVSAGWDGVMVHIKLYIKVNGLSAV